MNSEPLIGALEQIGNRYSLVTRAVEAAGRSWRLTAVEHEASLLCSIESDSDADRFPFGLLIWPASIGLANHLATDPVLLAGRRTIELGCGVGLAGIVAQSIGAHVTQTDSLPEALVLAAHNAQLNDVPGIELVRADWREFPDLGPFDIVIGSDILYEPASHVALTALLPRLLLPGGTLLISDPMRPHAFTFMQSLEAEGWQLDIQSNRVEWENHRREIALFTANR